jgi:hypothetical protein
VTGIGLELAPGAVRAAVVTRSGGELRLAGARDVPCESANASALTLALTQLRTGLGLREPVVLGLPATAVLLTTVRPLVVVPQRAALAVQFELSQQLPFQLADAAWHYQWLPQGRTNGGARMAASRETLVAAIRRTLLQERLAACQRAGIAVRAVAVNPIAVVNAWQARRSAPRPAGVVLANHSDAATGEWVRWSPTHFHVATLDGVGAQADPAALAAAWQALRAQWEEPPEVVWVIGPPEQVERMRAAVGPGGRPSVEAFDLGQVVRLGSSRLEHPERWAVPVGLALQGLEAAPVPLNLLAAAQGQALERRARQAAWALCGLFALATVGLALSGMVTVRARRLRLLQALERREHLYQSLRPQVRSLLQRQEATTRRTEALARLMTDAGDAARLLVSVTEALPPTMWLMKFEAARDGAPGVQIEGRARSFQDVTGLVDRLKALPGATGVKPLSTNVVTDERTGKDAIAFAVRIDLAALPPPAEAVRAAAPREAGERPVRPARKAP